MMFDDKRGQGISMTYIVIAALALVVLVVIVLFFTGGIQKLFQQQQQNVEGATDQQKETWRAQCKLYCNMGQKDSFCGHLFKTEENGKFWVCDEDKFDLDLGKVVEPNLKKSDLQSLEVACDKITSCS